MFSRPWKLAARGVLRMHRRIRSSRLDGKALSVRAKVGGGMPVSRPGRSTSAGHERQATRTCGGAHKLRCSACQVGMLSTTHHVRSRGKLLTRRQRWSIQWRGAHEAGQPLPCHAASGWLYDGQLSSKDVSNGGNKEAFAAFICAVSCVEHGKGP